MQLLVVAGLTMRWHFGGAKERFEAAESSKDKIVADKGGVELKGAAV